MLSADFFPEVTVVIRNKFHSLQTNSFFASESLFIESLMNHIVLDRI